MTLNFPQKLLRAPKNPKNWVETNIFLDTPTDKKNTSQIIKKNQGPLLNGQILS